MNLTVGPLPSAVYWRRRAIVGGLVLLGVLIVAFSCGGSGKSNAAKQNPAGDFATGTASGSSPSDSPAPILGGGSALPVPSLTPSATSTGQPGSGSGSSPSSDLCTDADIQLTAGFTKITGGSTPYQLTLKVKNASDRTCKRDVGANPQELHIVANGQTVWSSDSCQKSAGQPDVRSFGPGIEDTFTISWDGTIGSQCTGGTMLTSGTYQVVAKLDTKISSPTPFTLTGLTGS